MRPLASGEVTPTKAITFLAGQLSVGLAILTQLNLYSCVSTPALRAPPLASRHSSANPLPSPPSC